MSYVVLARRYRPQNLEQVIGQDHITRTLRNAIKENRVAHAYLFSGPRGVGKTTTARILAKALNCKKGPTEIPCGTCDNCREIAAGTSVDVQEIDGASNRGIDEIRALRENVKFAPAASNYKIYIIDEAHQITDAAFNALLKTLEEPPEHVVFILATTEPQKIPVTILSRCQRYRFRLISSDEIAATLTRMIKNEGFTVEPAALQVITAASGGSLRDALSLLDQAVSFSPGTVTCADVQNLLGFLPKDVVASCAEAFAQEDGAKILAIIKDMSEQGYSLIQFGKDIREHLRHLLLFKVNPSILELTPDDRAVLEKQKNLFSPVWLIRSGHLLSRALDEMRWSDQPRLILELYLMKVAQPYVGVSELVERLEKLGKNLPFEEETPAPRVSQTVTGEDPAPPSGAAGEPPESTAPAAAGNAAALWNEVVAEFQRSHPLIGNVLAGATVEGPAGNTLPVNALNKFQQEGIKRHQAAIESLVEKKFGRSLSLRIDVRDGKPAAGPAGPEEIVVTEEISAVPASAATYQVEGDLTDPKNGIPPGLEKIVDKFPGRITKKKNNLGQ